MNTGRRGESSSTSAFIEMKDNPSIMKNAGAASVEKRAEIKDIEHVPVRDDPRAWSNARKNAILVIVASASMIATLGANIYNPAINNIKTDLHASDAEIALSLSIFIIVQGSAPLFWSAVSEIKGRKSVYLTSELTFIVGCIIVATAKNIAVVIAMRCLQAFGASAVLSIGAATLADIYEPHERGTMMGIYYAAPLLGPSLGPLVGGILTQLFNWRATFWFLVIFGVVSLASFVLFKDTFRRERSLAYQAALRRITVQMERKSGSATPELQSASALAQSNKIPADSNRISMKDLEATRRVPVSGPQNVQEIKLSMREINPISPLLLVLKRKNNVTILLASGFFFGFGYSIAYTCSRTLSNAYHYNALKIGLVLLSFGLGCMGGSVLGGRWSDRVLRQLKARNGGHGYPEMRLESAKLAMAFLPISCIAYGWLSDKRVHIAAICVALFFSGFFSIWMYSSTLAYIVDANTGRSSTAVATNSSFRGVFGFVAAEVAVPLQNAMGDGGLYTLWGGLMAIAELLILLVIWKGGKWRETAIAKEASRQVR